jgi:predicted MFS family arabinose efflux permease
VTDETPPRATGPADEPAAPPRLKLPDTARLTRGARVAATRAVLRRVPGNARSAFRVDLTSMFLTGLYTGAVFPFVSVIARDDLKASTQVLAMLTAAPFLGNLMALFWARAMEGREKVPFVKWSQVAARVCIFLTLFAVGAWPFALVIGAAQVIGTIATPAYAAIIKDVYPDETRGQILSFTKSTVIAAQVLATLIAGWLMKPSLPIPAISYRFVFPVAGLIGIVAALVFGRIHPAEAEQYAEVERPREPIAEQIKETGRFVWSTLGILRDDQAFRWFALSVFTYGFGNLMTIPLIPVIQVNELHISKSEVAVLTNVMQVVAVVAYFYWGRYVDRRSPQRAVVVNILFNTTVPMVYILTAFVPGVNAWTLLPAYLFSGLVLAGIDMAYFNALLTFSGPENVSRYQALQSFLLGIRGSIAPFVGSWLAEGLKAHHQNLRWVFVIGLVFMFTGAWMQLMATRRQEALDAAC